MTGATRAIVMFLYFLFQVQEDPLVFFEKYNWNFLSLSNTSSCSMYLWVILVLRSTGIEMPTSGESSISLFKSYYWLYRQKNYENSNNYISEFLGLFSWKIFYLKNISAVQKTEKCKTSYL